jgi:uncharacterized protein
VIHPRSSVRFVSAEIGDGVFATQRIPRGTIVWAQDRFDRVLEPAEIEALDRALRELVFHYAHVDAKRNYVLCWDAGKLMNHSCDPAVRGIGSWMQVARRELEEGEEITCDYAECNIEEPLDCRCGASACRHQVRARDLVTHAAEWDAEARALLADARRVEQPLWPYLLDREEARALLWELSPLPSFRALYAFG